MVPLEKNRLGFVKFNQGCSGKRARAVPLDPAGPAAPKSQYGGRFAIGDRGPVRYDRVPAHPLADALVAHWRDSTRSNPPIAIVAAIETANDRSEALIQSAGVKPMLRLTQAHAETHHDTEPGLII